MKQAFVAHQGFRGPHFETAKQSDPAPIGQDWPVVAGVQIFYLVHFSATFAKPCECKLGQLD